MRVLLPFGLLMLATLGSVHCKSFLRPLYFEDQVEQQVLAKVTGLRNWLGIAGCALQNIFGNNGDSLNGEADIQNRFRNALQSVIRCIPDSSRSEEVEIMELLKLDQQETEQRNLANANGFKDFLGVTGCALNNIFGNNDGDSLLDEEAVIERKIKGRKRNGRIRPTTSPQPSSTTTLKNILQKITRCLPESGVENINEEAVNELAVMMVTKELEEEVAQEEKVMAEEEVAQEEGMMDEEEVAQEEEVEMADEEEEIAEEQFITLGAILAKVVAPLVIDKLVSSLG